MRRRLPWILAALLVLVIGGAIALVVVAKPDLDDARDAVDTNWQPLRAPLTARYDQLATTLAALDAAGGGDRSIAKDLTKELATWKKVASGGDAGAQAEVANRLEGEAARLRANVFVSPRLAASADLTSALSAFAGTAPPRALVADYNRAVRTYEDTRNDSLRKPVARLFGYDGRPILVIEQ